MPVGDRPVWGRLAGVTRPTGTVSFLFTDIEGSTQLWESSPQSMGTALGLHDHLVRSTVAAHGGFLFSTAGDGIGASFQRAADAVGAAVALQVGLRRVDWPDGVGLRVRVGVHTGEAEERDGDYFGPPVNRAARVMSAANGGQIVVSSTTAEVIGAEDGLELVDLGTYVLKGVPDEMQLYGVSAEGWRWDDRPLTAPRPGVVRLPRAVHDLIGRENELERLIDELDHRRVVTLTGPGGVGKTRLAVEAAWRMAPSRPDGVVMVELAPVGDPQAVINSVATAIDARPQDQESLLDAVVGALSNRSVLVVLDNCEHVIDAAAAVVARVGADCPAVTVLATSREPLGVPGETVVRVASLDTEGAAVELFCQRAREADAGLDPLGEGREVVEALCRRLDGIPLALELAAAQVRSFTVGQLTKRLDDRFRLLRSGRRGGVERHETLRTTIDWSFRLLSEEEQMLFARMSVFAGGADLEAVEVVCGDGPEDGDVMDLLGSLVDKSMVLAERTPSGMRYRQLETLRQYGEEQLIDAGGSDAVHRRHLDRFRTLAEAHGTAYNGADPAWSEAEAWFAVEWDNLREAHTRALEEGDAASFEALCTWTYRWAIDHLRVEHAEWVRRSLAHFGSGDRSGGPDHAARLMGLAAGWAASAGDWEATLDWAKKSLTGQPDATQHGSVSVRCEQCLALYQLGRADELARAMDELDALLPAPTAFEDTGALLILHICAALAHTDRRVEFGQHFREKAGRLANPPLTGWVGFADSLDALYAGDTSGALARLDEALSDARAIRDHFLEGALQGLLLVALAGLGDESAPRSLRIDTAKPGGGGQLADRVVVPRGPGRALGLERAHRARSGPPRPPRVERPELNESLRRPARGTRVHRYPSAPRRPHGARGPTRPRRSHRLCAHRTRKPVTSCEGPVTTPLCANHEPDRQPPESPIPDRDRHCQKREWVCGTGWAPHATSTRGSSRRH